MSSEKTKAGVRYLYLVQHGEAKAKEVDPERSLTEQGQSEVAQVADWAAQAGLQVEEIRHSGKRRAQQTAEILARKLNLSHRVVAVPGLAPLDDVQPMAEALEQETRSVMLVGHLPFLSRLASQLLAGDSERTVIRFRMAGIVALSREQEGWAVAFMVTPNLLTGSVR
ncbi:MAG: phosphohistidine phosphatase SixA [bacterium]